MEVLNKAINQWILVRASSGPDFEYISTDAECEIKVLPSGVETSIKSPKPAPAGGKSSEVVLDIVQLQDFVEESVLELTKIFAGSTPEYVVKIRLKGKAPESMDSANEILKKIKPDWKF